MRKKEVRYLSSGDFSRLKSQVINQRDKLILEILYESGCTVNELVQIKIKDIDFKHWKVTFPAQNTKSNKQKVCSVSKNLIEKIKLFVNNSSLYLFSTRQSSQMTTKRIRQIIQSCAKRAQLGKVNPQTLRYTHIYHALEKGIPMRAIQRQVGMERLRMVQIYEAIIPEEKENVYERFWLNE